MKENIKKNIALGICVGASTIKAVKLFKSAGNKIEIISKESFIHNGNPREVLEDYFGNMKESNIYLTVTGRKFKNLLSVSSIPEAEAIELAFNYLGYNGKYDTIASLGGENFIVYTLDEKGHIQDAFAGNKCASGTGEFFLQQINRMNIPVEDAVKLSEKSEPYLVSGRCSVFCKSDCTHALNKGIQKEHVVSGLAKMIADKAIELISKSKCKNLLITGGVSKNYNVVNFIRQRYENVYVSEYSEYLEAIGAAINAWNTESSFENGNILVNDSTVFNFLKPLSEAKGMVKFSESKTGIANPGDECIIGLDVGSTTTKAVIIRVSDNSLLASEYLRTNGNPISATIECYKSIKEKINVPIKIIGLGTTGSGRQIAALYSLTNGIVNEIIAHAVAAAYFDKDVDTIFEIGGQDAKYTFLTNGVASDYAMNEACSAGTGSFIEEAAKESLDIEYKEIADIAFKSSNPINFNDQCAAFISSDIKTASQEGLPKEDIVAGLVYSICLNYVNRVKGNRQVGKKILMQGGVCYNKAIPFAMANIVGKEIIIPPEPGLMGAFGVALEIKNRIELGFLERQEFFLEELINREFVYSSEFICSGGFEKCDRKCSIAMIEIEGKKYPFGGACNKYYNQRLQIIANPAENDFVKLRRDLLFPEVNIKPQGSIQKTVGINKSFLTNSIFPLFLNYFNKLGYNVLLSDNVDSRGTDKMRTSYCYPAEISHGLFYNLLSKKPDFIFLPHITQMESKTDSQHNRLCVFVQGEQYYLKSAFSDDKLPELLSPVIDFTKSEEEIKKAFLPVAKKLGKTKRESDSAYDFAANELKLIYKELYKYGEKYLKEIDDNSVEFGVVLFGRAYNSFAKEANLNIPHKFASKNIKIIPHDILPVEGFETYENMYWYSGNQILRAARFVEQHPKLFGVFITNYSCGPDSFIIPYFRNIMGNKPSLTLELDSHSADVGIDTRIDAAIDIIRNYIEINKYRDRTAQKKKFNSLEVTNINSQITVKDSDNNSHSITSRNIEVLIPSMGRFSTAAFAATFRHFGMNAHPMPVPSFTTLQHGRGQTTCKECLPFILTTGSLIEHLKNKKNKDLITLFFMPHGFGPCRQGQYHIMLKDIINEMNLENVGVLTMNDENAFNDYGNDLFMLAWLAMMLADVIHDIESVVLTLAKDKKTGLEIIEAEWEKIIKTIETGINKNIYSQLEKSAKAFKGIELTTPLEEAKVISLIGEIYVRREEFSRGDLIKTLHSKGFVVKTAPITEYVYYSNFLLRKGLVKEGNEDKTHRMKYYVKERYQRGIEKKVKTILSKSGMITRHLINVDKTIDYAKELISEELLGETILTTGLALREILDESCGVISIGPFNCVPSRLSEAILNKEMTLEGKYKFGKIHRNGYPASLKSLPFLYVESDGNPYPQITQSRIEIFLMQAEKLHQMLLEKKKAKSLH